MLQLPGRGLSCGSGSWKISESIECFVLLQTIFN